MKHLILTFLMACTCFYGKAQIVAPVLSAGSHATLDSVVVLYSPVSTGTVSPSVMKVKAGISIKLKTGATEKIVLQILNPSDSSLVYAVDYALATVPYSSSQGEVLFSGQGLKFLVVCPLTLPLSTYLYKVHTRNAQGIPSAVFMTRQ